MVSVFLFFQAEDGIRDLYVTGVQTCALPILVDVMLADGVTSRASDIHVEPIEGGVVVRYRIDGVLRQVMKIPRNAGLPRSEERRVGKEQRSARPHEHQH